MKYLLVIVSILLTLSVASAQYPGDECRWECEVIYCDYYHDYCDYDCHEVCYPYSPLRFATKKSPFEQWRPQLQQKLGRDSLGKVVKMRIQNPSFQTMRGQEIIATRGSPPVGLAVFQSCLSNRDTLQPQTSGYQASDVARKQ